MISGKHVSHSSQYIIIWLIPINIDNRISNTKESHTIESNDASLSQAVHSSLPSTATKFSETLLWARWVLDSREIRMTRAIKVLAFIQKIEVNKQKNNERTVVLGRKSKVENYMRINSFYGVFSTHDLIGKIRTRERNKEKIM